MKKKPADDELDAPEPSPYLRRSKRVEVRRSAVRWKRVLLLGALIALLCSGVLGAAAYGIGAYLISSPRFTLQQSLFIQGGDHVTRGQVGRIFAPDIGRSIFRIPLERRRAQLSALPWVESAQVVRSWPDRIRVLVRERQPVAFVRLQSNMSLIDRQGVLLPLPIGGKFHFPVVNGINESQTVAERRNRIGVVTAVMADLDRETPHRSGDVSEIDVGNPEDSTITVSQGASAVTVHLGNAHFLERYKLFLGNVENWREQYGSVHSVELQYEKQVIVKP
jgi:cell division protein FtsQ